jgi:hypothetical protein
MHIGGAEATAEIAGGRRIGNTLSTEGVEVDFILATQFEVLQAGAVAQRVVGQVEYMIGLVVRQVNLEQVQFFIDGVDEADAPRQKMDGADATVRQAASAVGDLVMNVGGGEHRMVQVAESFLVEPAFDSALAVLQELVYLGIHSKSLSVAVDDGIATSSDAAESQRISSFFSFLPRRSAASSLDQGLNAAKETIKELSEILERVQKEPLILYTVDRLSKDNKHAYVKKGETDLRIEACKDLKKGDEVLLHPKTFQIVERLGKPPLEASRFAPDTIPDVKWDNIGGLAEAKADLIEAVELPHKNKGLFEYYGKKQIKGILLAGPPGCGKTMLGKAAANSLATIYGKENARTGFLYVKGPEILNQYVGQTEQTIREMFEDARRHKVEHGYPAIIFLDEADAILATRGTRNVGIGNTIVPMFLTEMD